MVEPHRLSRTDACRIAVRAQLLDAERPGDVVDAVRTLAVVQLDPISAVAPSADLVLGSRIGSTYAPADLAAALADRSLVELYGQIRPAEDVALHRAAMAVWPGSGELRDWQVATAAWVRANDGCRRDILELLDAGAPLTSRELPDTCVEPWRSSGWTNNQNVTKLLDFLVARGEVAVAGRRGRDRLWDLAERVYPDDPVPSEEEARRLLDQRRLGYLGIARARGASSPGEPVDVGPAGEPAVVEGVKGEWRVDPVLLGETLGDVPFAGRTALLSPLDRLVHDRVRMEELFGFDYQLEMYKPAAKRRWGYYALPILVGERLVGKLDAKADRKAGVLRVHAVHEDEPLDAATRAAVHEEVEDLAEWLGLGVERSDW